MPIDGLANHTAPLKSHPLHICDDLSDNVTAEARLRQEAASIRASPPTKSSYTRGIRDITTEFVAATEQLQAGDLVKDESFTLFEAVGALEIMDPKMDSGYIPESDTFEPDFDVNAELEASEVLWIMDELFRLEMTFHEGYPLSQNVFTSLHIFDLIGPSKKYPYGLVDDSEHIAAPARLGKHSESILKAEHGLVTTILLPYCVGLLKCIEISLNTIQAQIYFEEEDFVTSLFGRELLSELNHSEAIQRLEHAKKSIGRLREDVGEAMWYALQGRLQMRICMIKAMIELDTDSKGFCETSLKFAKHQMDRPGHHQLAKPIAKAFSAKVQRQLATSTPPRPMPDMLWEDAVGKWTRLCDDMMAINALTAPAIRKNPESLLRALWIFAYRDPHPATFVRAKMQELLTAGESVQADTRHFDLMLTDIRDTMLPAHNATDLHSFQIEVPKSPLHQASQIMTDFMTQAYGDWLNLYLFACQNRCRMRRCFTQALSSWQRLGELAADADRELAGLNRSNPEQTRGSLLRWTKHHLHQIRKHVIQLGFETELYLPDEYSGIYHFLGNDMKIHHAMLVNTRDIFMFERAKQEKGTDFSYIKLDATTKELKSAAEHLQSIAIRLSLDTLLADALAQLFGLLESLRVIRAPPSTDQKLRAEARMKPFLSEDAALLVQRRSFHTIKDTFNNIEEIKTQCLAHLRTLKALSPQQVRCIGTDKERIAELQSMTKVIFETAVSMHHLKNICAQHDRLDNAEGMDYSDIVKVSILPVEKRQHPWWVVPQIEERRTESTAA